MKKILSFILVLTTLFSLCGGFAIADEGAEVALIDEDISVRSESGLDWAPESLDEDAVEDIDYVPEDEFVIIDSTEAETAEESEADTDEPAVSGEASAEAESSSTENAEADNYDGLEDSVYVLDGEPAVYSHKDNDTNPTAGSKHYFETYSDSVSIYNQGSKAVCWSIAAMTCLQISNLRNSISTGVNLLNAQSVSHLVNYAYNGFTDSLCNPKKDYIYPATQYGNVQASLMTLASWAGAALTYDASKTNDIYSDDVMHVKNGYWLSLASDSDRTAVKQSILDYGAAALSLYVGTNLTNSSSSYYNAETHAYCYTGDVTGTDHEVVIVGWDDEYPAENFKTIPVNSDNQPLGGAWLCRNSWGSSWGDGGYFWISYYDTCLQSKSVALVFDVDSADNYDNIYQYDCSYSMSAYYTTDNSSVKIANIFTAAAYKDSAATNKQELLKAVGTYTLSPGMSYTAKIYTGLPDKSNPVSGTEKATLSGTFNYAGYHTVTLATPIALDEGEIYSVVFEFTYPESVTTRKVPICTTISVGSRTARNASNAGESFFYDYDGSSWIDRYTTTKANFRIKAYTDCIHQINEVAASTATCAKAGNIKYYKCAVCGECYSDEAGSTVISEASTVTTGTHCLTHHSAAAADCTTAGNIEYWQCDNCSRYFSDENAETEITEADTVIAASHTLTHHEAREATCLVSGNKEYWQCDDCYKCFSDAAAQTEIDVGTIDIGAAHKLTHYAAKAATATVAGNIEYWQCSECEKYFSDENGTTEITEAQTIVEATGFTDVTDGSFYEDAVSWAVNEGITTGTNTAGTLFSPSDSCTRAQIVTFLWRANGSPAPTSTTNPFTDVKSGSYYYNAVLWAVEQGITTGTAKDKFSPTQICNRSQVVTFLWRAKGSPKPVSTSTKFTDLRSGAYYYDAVLWAVEQGITSGTNTAGTLFSPNQQCNRAQAVTFLYRAYNK